jgi:hypothetical protein
MDSDRKSTVSSFYGARKTEALHQDYPPQPTSGRGRDDASSFFQPDRSSMDHLNARSSAGYNRGSFFHAGREEPLKGGIDEEADLGNQPDAWDVYADFNNAGPRYSTAFGIGQTKPTYVDISSDFLNSFDWLEDIRNFLHPPHSRTNHSILQKSKWLLFLLWVPSGGKTNCIRQLRLENVRGS